MTTITTADTFYKIGYSLENKAIKLQNNGMIDEARECFCKAAWALSSAGWLENAKN
jgi:hypothetical protein